MPSVPDLVANTTSLLLTMVDKQTRTPLFYACAANKVDCVSLIVLRQSSWLDDTDDQLDTCVHVCCFFGWKDCLERLLQSGANPHVKNAKGFRPSHIAKTPACLQLLLSYGDDLIQGDVLGRSPLFTACARSRDECVAYLCQWDYDSSQSWMMEQQDDRGDRPIHAAACNGSLGCIQILLQYGVDLGPCTRI